MLAAPAMAPAMPANLTTEESTPLLAKPMTSDTFDTKPSLIPNTAARARPPDTERCPGCCSLVEMNVWRLMDVTLVGFGRRSSVRCA